MIDEPADPDVRIEGLMIHGEVFLPAPPDQVFDALTTPQWLQAWWGDDDAYVTQEWQIRAEAGTPWSCSVQVRTGQHHRLSGQVLQARRPHELRLSWEPSWLPGLHTEVCFELQPQGEGTWLRLRHTGFRPDTAGLTTFVTTWPWVLRWLRAFRGPAAGSPAR